MYGSSTASWIDTICSRRPPDVLVGDVRDLFEDELVHLGLRELLEDEARARIEQQMVAGAHRDVAQRVGDQRDALLVGAGDDRRALGVDELLERDDLAGLLEPARLDDVQRLVQHHFLARDDPLHVDLRVDVHAELASAGEHVDGAVGVQAEEDTEAGRRRRELLDLFAQERDLLAGLLEHPDEAFVLLQRLDEPALELAEALLEQTDRARVAAAERLFGGPAQLVAELDQLALDVVERRPSGCCSPSLTCATSPQASRRRPTTASGACTPSIGTPSVAPV